MTDLPFLVKGSRQSDQRVFDLLGRAIPKPDLLIALRPVSAQALATGIRERAEACGGEQGER